MLSHYAALLRGINVGGQNKLAMKDLSALFVKCGCASVRTYIQSGNVLFAAEPKLAGAVAEQIGFQIFKKFGYRTPVVLRTAEELHAIAASNPFLKGKSRGNADAEEDFLHVMFLADTPDQQLVNGLDSDRSPGDEFRVLGNNIYLHLPNGAGRTKLNTTYFDSKLKTIGTQRNWQTVLKLVSMLKESSS